MALTRILLALAFLIAGCDGARRTQILIEVDSDLVVPSALDLVTVAVTDPSGSRTQVAEAPLGTGNLPLPRILGMVYQGGPLGPYEARVRGELGGAVVVERLGTLTFQEGHTHVWRIELLAECSAVACPDGQTCARGGCRDAEVLPGEFSGYDGSPIPRDAGPFDACTPTERCNGVDDDCDGRIDEDIDLTTDPSNCGECGNVCDDATNGTGACIDGACGLSCDPGFGDCDGMPENGCETDTTTSGTDCGGCGTACRPPEDMCCAGTCARTC